MRNALGIRAQNTNSNSVCFLFFFFFLFLQFDSLRGRGKYVDLLLGTGYMGWISFFIFRFARLLILCHVMPTLLLDIDRSSRSPSHTT